jgi:uncharacterized protein YfaS (alpha-2-macroglobulin family)
MRENRQSLKSLGVYLAVGAIALTVGAIRMHASASAQGGAPDKDAAAGKAEAAAVKPYFSLSTNRTYGSIDRARVWINYQGIDYLDFRVYKVKKPFEFFKGLNDPHQMGEREKTEVASDYGEKPNPLEKVRTFKVSILKSIKDYFRRQLHREAREAFTQKFSSNAHLPLNEADYARVPLLNSDQLVDSFRQPLSPLDNAYDNRMVLLGKRDPGVYLVEAVNADMRAYSIAIVTDLTMITKTSPDGGLVVYTADRKTGAPRDRVQVEAVKGRKSLTTGATDSSGILKTRIKLDAAAKAPAGDDQEEGDEDSDRSKVGRDSYLIMASKGDQFAISDLEPAYFAGGGEGEPAGSYVGYCYTDRPVYRPGQKVYFKAIVRVLGEGGYQTPGLHSLKVTVDDPDGGKVLDRDLPVSARGTIQGDLDIAGGAKLGSYNISVSLPGESDASAVTGSFEVEEYKKPEYKVTVTTPKKFAQVGDKTSFAIEARYFFGEPVTNASVKYYIYRSRYYAWWWAGDDEGDDLGDSGQNADNEDTTDYGYGNDMVKDGEGHLDSNGRMVVPFEIPRPDDKDPSDYTYRLEAQVTDPARRAMEGVASVIGTRGNVVADASPDRYVYYQGDNAKIRVRTSDYEGHPVSAKISLKFIHRTWEVIEKKDATSKYDRYEYKAHETEMGSAEVTTNSQGQGEYSYSVPATGNFEIKAIVDEGARHYSSNGGWLWVADRGDRWADFSYENSEQIKLIPDKKSYQPGDTAHVLAMLPFDKTHLLVTTELEQVLTARIVEAGGRAVMIDVPIEARYSPNAYLSVCLIKDGDLYSQDHILSVPARNKFLKLNIVTDKNEYKPRDTASYTILARNQDGSPAAGTEVSLGLVDEAIYSIKPDQSGDIRRAFYGRRYNRVQTQFSVSYSFSGYSGDKPIPLAQVRKAFELADFKNDGQYATPTIRKDFKDTAFWQADAVTGSDGKATLSVSLPDNLTTWRATAKAVTADTRLGSSLAKVVSRKNLILRLETPRFLTKGDTVTISGIVHNYLNADKTVRVKIDVNGTAKLLDQAERTITLAKQGEQRIDWRVSATQVGDADLVATAKADQEDDGVELPLPVVPAGLQNTTGGTMSISENSADKSMQVDVPGAADPQARYLRIEVAPSIAGSLFGALDYLTSYPYGCTEQTMSSFLPNIAVAQALKDVKSASIKGNNNLGAKIQRGMNRLYDFQHADGGWGWWKDDKTDPFMTAYVVDGLTMATRAGYPADTGRIAKGQDKLRQMISSGKLENGKAIDMESRSYMIYALAASGDTGVAAINDLFNRRNELQPYGRALLALSLKLRGDDGRSRQVAHEIESSAKTNEFEAHWDSERKPMLDFSERDDLEATAMSLKALSQITPSSSISPKIARWLLTNRRFGYYWDSTRQTAFAILGLIDYIKVTKELSADYDVEVYVNGQQVGQTRHLTSADAASGTSILIERKAGEVPGSNQIRIVKRGAGVAYVSAALQYYSREEDVQAQSTPDLSITREYMRLVIKGTEDKPTWSIEPLNGEVRSGDTLVVRLRVKGYRNYYMMIEDPIPAGCEQLDRISGLNLDYSDGKWSDWYSDREFRDQKTLIFVNYFSGSDTFQYALTVQEPGDFRAAPARAELMYAPTVQANTGAAKLSILDKK